MTTKRSTVLALAVALAATAACSGCQVFAAGLAMAFPEEKVPAEFELPDAKSSKVLIFADDMFNPISYPPAKRALTEKMNQILIEKQLAAEVIPYDRLRDLETAEPDFNRLAVSTVGKRLGADLVIYVLLNPLSLKDNPADSFWRGRFSGRVRVVDTHQRRRIWPEESAGREIKVLEPQTENSSPTYDRDLALKLGEHMGVAVAQLFHVHYVDRAQPPQGRLDLAE